MAIILFKRASRLTNDIRFTLRTRAELEALEEQALAPYANKSRDKHLTRQFKEDEHPYRTAYQRDRDRIIHSRAFRRLKHKRQVFLTTESDHYRTRITHTLEVAQLAGTMARALGLNEDLVEAIALGHDLGHTPFGHLGEVILNEIMTGKRLFQGEDVTDTLATILKGEPDWAALPENTPPTIHLLLRKCLNKDRERRLHDIADARIDLEQALGDPTSPIIRLSDWALQETAKHSGIRPLLAIGAMVLVALELTWFLKPSPPTTLEYRVEVVLGGTDRGDKYLLD